MNPSALQRMVDELLATSAQQWLLRLVAVVAAFGAIAAAAMANDRWWPFGVVVVVSFSLASAIRPDTHLPFIVIVVIAAHWLATVDDLATPWLPTAGVCLLVFHTVIALAATVPIGGQLPTGVIGRWLWRSALGAGVTVGVWVVAVVFEQRDQTGNGLLTGLALAIVATAAVMIWSRSVAPSDEPKRLGRTD